MMRRRRTPLPGLTLALLLTLLSGGVRADDRTLEGTWEVTLQFPVCSAQCPCPGGTPNLPIPVVQRYAQHGSFLEISGGSLFRSPGLGSWERRGHHQFEARFTFFLFNNDATFSRRGAEEVTTRIDLTGPDTFAAHATFDFFDAAGNLLSPQDGCPINENGRRFE